MKRTALSEFAEASGRQNGIVAMKLAADDRVVAVFPGWDEYELLLVTANGQGIRFAEDEVRPVGRAGGRDPRHPPEGRRSGHRRRARPAAGEIVVIATEQGFAKRTEVDEFPVQARGGSGLKAAKIDKARGKLVAVTAAADTLGVPRGRRVPRRSRPGCARRVTRRRGFEGVPGGSAARRCRRSAPRRRLRGRVPTGYGAGFSTVCQSRVVRYVRKCSATSTRSCVRLRVPQLVEVREALHRPHEIPERDRVGAGGRRERRPGRTPRSRASSTSVGTPCAP